MKITIPEMKHTIVRLTEDLTLRKKRLTELKAQQQKLSKMKHIENVFCKGSISLQLKLGQKIVQKTKLQTNMPSQIKLKNKIKLQIQARKQV